MTERKHLKTRVRARMARTGERYATARAHVAGTVTPTGGTSSIGGTDGSDQAPLDPATTALAVLLDGIGRPVSTPLALVLGGGIGMGVFQFHYEAEGASSFFLAGRHRWDDDRGYLVDALTRLGIAARTAETGSARVARRHLEDALAESRPVVAWVDAATLGTRGYPDRFRGGVYHLVLVDGITTDGTVTVRDLADVPLQLDGERFMAACGRIAKDRHRLLWLPAGTTQPGGDDVQRAVTEGLAATVRGLRSPRMRSFGLDALANWRDRLRDVGTGAWGRVFPPGGRLFDALTAVATGIGTYGTDGALHRRTFATGLRAAASLLGATQLDAVADRYDELAVHWSALARAALPDDVPPLQRAAELIAARDRRYRAAGATAGDELAAAWQETEALRAEVEGDWPMTALATRALLDDLADRVATIHAGETTALEALDAARPGSA